MCLHFGDHRRGVPKCNARARCLLTFDLPLMDQLPDLALRSPQTRMYMFDERVFFTMEKVYQNTKFLKIVIFFHAQLIYNLLTSD